MASRKFKETACMTRATSQAGGPRLPSLSSMGSSSSENYPSQRHITCSKGKAPFFDNSRLQGMEALFAAAPQPKQLRSSGSQAGPQRVSSPAGTARSAVMALRRSTADVLWGADGRDMPLLTDPRLQAAQWSPGGRKSHLPRQLPSVQQMSAAIDDLQLASTLDFRPTASPFKRHPRPSSAPAGNRATATAEEKAQAIAALRRLFFEEIEGGASADGGDANAAAAAAIRRLAAAARTSPGAPGESMDGAATAAPANR
mmetsp:Transcript_45220/g.114745  ORF Transcript_45220/g.114745 Transcript_45220/m.114745 type:complete len:257 (-) Transcript_45220:323-1093(-)